jgi:hypothetical protein
MKQKFNLLSFFLLITIAIQAQDFNDSIYKNWWANKNSSIFQTVEEGVFSGSCTGYLHVKDGLDTLLLDFQSSKTTLNVIHDEEEMYDISTKEYVTKTTSGKTTLVYEVYALANSLTILLNGSAYNISRIDGASDMPINGLTFNYCSEKSTEYLTLFVTKSIDLNTTKTLMRKEKMTYSEALKQAKTITLLPGSTLILMLNK